MATPNDDRSQNAQEWLIGDAEPMPGQLDLLGTAGAEPDKPALETSDGTGHRAPRQRRRRGKAKKPATPERPASLQRPPGRPMTVAEVVAQRLEANRGEGDDH